jgi:predicted DNA-binding transcriptional regulator AlpA
MPNKPTKATTTQPILQPEPINPLTPAERLNKEMLQQTLLDNLEVMQLLHISRGTLYNWRKNGYITCSKIGGRLYFEVADIYKMLKERKQKKWKTAA